MPDPHDFVRDVEQRIELPDFEAISRRGQRLRRRRTLAVTGSVAAVVAVVAVALARPWVAERAAPPTVPIVSDTQAVAILADPDSFADDDGWVVSDTGAVIDTVVAPGDRPDPLGCGDDDLVALVWTPADGRSRAWSERVPARFVVARPGGFVVSAVAPRCRTGADGEDAAYVVDADGLRTPVTWAGEAGACPQRPDLRRCVVDVATATGGVDAQPGTDVPPGLGAVLGDRWGDEVWARSVHSGRIYWSVDGGHTWAQHRTSLTGDPASNLQVTASGDWIVFARGMRLEYSSDHGATWQSVDVRSALAPIRIAAEVWSVLPSGVLLGVTQPVGSRSVLFHSTDSSWTTFEETEVTTAYGTTVPRLAGGWVYVRDQGNGWISHDGEHWTLLDPLAQH